MHSANEKHRSQPIDSGITLSVLQDWRGRLTTAADVAALAEAEDRAIYHARYVTRPRFAEIADVALAELVIDTGVLHGPTRAARWLQEVVSDAGHKLKVDGEIGSVSLAAINALPPRPLFASYLARRIRGYADFVQSAPDQLVNLEGWNTRAASFINR